MKRNQVIIGVLLLVCFGLGIFALVKSRAPSSSDSDDEAPAENVIPVVTVQTGALKRMTLHNYVSGFGKIDAAPATSDSPAAGAQLAASVPGVIAKVNAALGQRVEKGDVLVELNSAAMTFDYAQTELARQKKLLAQQNASQKNVQNAEAQLSSLEIIAPISGTITRLNANVGQAVDVSTSLVEIVNLKRLAVSAKIPAADAGKLKPGEEIQISGAGFQPANGQDARATTASLSFVSPVVDAEDGTVLARALLPPADGLRPGEFVRVKIVTTIHTNCLAAPEESIVTDEKGESVIALVKGDEAAQVPVKIGLRENGWIEVESPQLKAGDAVVTIGAYGLPEKTKIRVSNSPVGSAGSSQAQ
jgi:cobalt-zinc-cadmium efflux system membrane fusion protein